MEEFIIFNFLGKKYLCSQNICLEDKVYFYPDNNEEKVLIGKVNEINKEKGSANIRIYFDKFTQTAFNQSFADYNVNIESCFYPIIEIFNNFDDDKHLNKIYRDQIQFDTICPKCLVNSRLLDTCDAPMSDCKKTNKKPYAFIKI